MKINIKKPTNMNDTKNSWENRQTEDLLAGKIDQATDCAGKTAEKSADTMKNGVKQTTERIGEMGRKAGEAVRDGAAKAADKVGNAIDSAADRLQNKTTY